MNRTVLLMGLLVCLLSACGANRQAAATPTVAPTVASTVASTAAPTVVPTVVPATGFGGGIEAEASRDGVITLVGNQQQLLPSPQQTILAVGDGVNVDSQGRAILRFADLLTVEVLRDGELQVQELSADEQSAFVTLLQSGGAFLNNFDPQAEIDRRFTVQTSFAVITATGTRFLVVKEADSPLEWLLGMEAEADDLTVYARNDPTPGDPAVMPMRSGTARWIAPIGVPSPEIVYDQEAVQAWLSSVQQGESVREIGEVLLPQADEVISMAPLVEMGESGQLFRLGDIGVILDAAPGYGDPAYRHVDCNGDGVRDLAMQSGRVILEFRSVMARVRGVDITVSGYNSDGRGSLQTFDPAYAHMNRQDFAVEPGELQVVSVRAEQPYHFAELTMTIGCLIGVSLTPPHMEEPRMATPLRPQVQPTNTPQLYNDDDD